MRASTSTFTWGWISLQSVDCLRSPHWAADSWLASFFVDTKSGWPLTFFWWPCLYKTWLICVLTMANPIIFFQPSSLLNSYSCNQDSPSLTRQPLYLWEYSVLLHMKYNVHCYCSPWLCHNSLMCVWYEKLCVRVCLGTYSNNWFDTLCCSAASFLRWELQYLKRTASQTLPPECRTFNSFLCNVDACLAVFCSFFKVVSFFLLTGNKHRKRLQPVSSLGSSHIQCMTLVFSFNLWFYIVAHRDFHYFNRDVFLCGEVELLITLPTVFCRIVMMTRVM